MTQYMSSGAEDWLKPAGAITSQWRKSMYCMDVICDRKWRQWSGGLRTMVRLCVIGQWSCGCIPCIIWLPKGRSHFKELGVRSGHHPWRKKPVMLSTLFGILLCLYFSAESISWQSSVVIGPREGTDEYTRVAIPGKKILDTKLGSTRCYVLVSASLSLGWRLWPTC